MFVGLGIEILIYKNYWASIKWHMVSFLGTMNYGHANKIFLTENYWWTSTNFHAIWWGIWELKIQAVLVIFKLKFGKCSCHLMSFVGAKNCGCANKIFFG
jgi:hypothetical protein